MITETTFVSQVTWEPETALIYVRTTRRLMRGDEKISDEYHRHIIDPTMDIEGEPQEVRLVAAAVWTPEVIAAAVERQRAEIERENAERAVSEAHEKRVAEAAAAEEERQRAEEYAQRAREKAATEATIAEDLAVEKLRLADAIIEAEHAADASRKRAADAATQLEAIVAKAVADALAKQAAP